MSRQDVARHRQAHPSALARRVPDGGAASAHRAGRQGQRRGLLGDVRRGVRPPVLLRPRRAHRARGPAQLAARRVHGRGALHAALGELLPRPARARRGRARRAADGALRARGEVRLRRAAAARAPEPRARPPRLPPRADRDGRARARHGAGLLARARRATLEARVGDLEAAHDPVSLLVAGARPRDRAAAQPVRAPARRGRLVRRRPRPRPRRDPHLPRRADPLRHPVCDTARAGLPPAGRVRRRGAPRRPAVADRDAGRRGAHRRPGRHRVVGAPHARRRRRRRRRRLRDGVRDARAARLVDPPAERPCGAARAAGAARRGARRRSQLLRERHKGAAPETARERRAEARPAVERQPAGPVAPERFGVLQALLAHLLAACGDDRTAELDADELAERFSIPREELQETLSLLNLVNFGGGCYTVYARSTRTRAAFASTRSSTATSSAGRRS